MRDRLAVGHLGLGKRPNSFKTGDIVMPCTITENVTTPNAATTMALRPASEGGKASARASAALRATRPTRECAAGAAGWPIASRRR